MSPNGNLDTAPLCQTEVVRLRDCETPESNSYLSLLLGSGNIRKRRKELRTAGSASKSPVPANRYPCQRPGSISNPEPFPQLDRSGPKRAIQLADGDGLSPELGERSCAMPIWRGSYLQCHFTRLLRACR